MSDRYNRGKYGYVNLCQNDLPTSSDDMSYQVNVLNLDHQMDQ